MKGIDNAIKFFSEQELPFFIITDAKNIVCIAKNDKIDEVPAAAEKLRSTLKNFDTDSRSVYKIYCFAEVPAAGFKGAPKKIIEQSEHDICFDFCAYQPGASVGGEDAAYNKALWKVERELKEREQAERLERIEALLTQRQIEDEAESDEDIAEQMQPKSIVGALFEHPQIQGALAGAVAAWLSKITMPAAAPYAVAGVPGQADALTRIDAAISTLSAYDDKLAEHLEKLANMAVNDTNKFKFLLTML